MGASCTKIGAVVSNLLIQLNARRNEQKKRHHRGGDGQHHQRQDQQPQQTSSRTEKVLNWTLGELSHFATDAERRDLVSIGASVGFAASFGAPVGGMLFILDDISSYFERHLLLRMLVANAIGTFCLAVQHGDLSNYSIINIMGTYGTPDDDIFVNRLEEVPLYVSIGIGGGVLGGVFCAGHRWLRRNVSNGFPSDGRRARWFRLAEVAAVSVLTSIVLFYLPTVSWACKEYVVPVEGVDNFRDWKTEAYYEEAERKRFFCPEGEINEMATVMFGSRLDAIKEILTDPSAFQNRTLVSIGFVFFVLTLITFGTAIPSGIFTPITLVGAALGGACGNLFHDAIDEEISPSTFALLGMAALLAGVQRSTTSVAIILVEGTGQVKILIPVIIVVVIARYVAQSIHKYGVYETVIDYKQLPYLPHENLKRYYDAVQVKDIMSKPPLEVLGPRERVGDLVELLRRSSHNGFPVVDGGTTGRFLGLARRAQIAALLECGVFSKKPNISGEGDLVAAAHGIRVGENGMDGESAPLMHWAYKINDDRYEHVLSVRDKQSNPMESHSDGISMHVNLDEERNAEFSLDHAPIMLSKYQQEVNKSIRMSPIPTPNRRRRSCSSSWSLGEIPQDFCTVSRNDVGNVVVPWHNAEFSQYWVDLAAVANRGTYTVPEFCPVSKAYKLCELEDLYSIDSFPYVLFLILPYICLYSIYHIIVTALGLRHIIVLGGSTGGEVVGVLTRASFLDYHIEEESGL